MNFSSHNFGRVPKASLLVFFLCVGVSSAQNYASLGISDVVSAANRLLQRGEYEAVIPALQEVIRRTAPSKDPQIKETTQTCRFQLARAHYKIGEIPAGMAVLEDYFKNEPRTKERMALRMMAQGFLDRQEWGKIETVALRLLRFPDLSIDEIYNANLLLGQARFQLKKWEESIEPLSYAARKSKDKEVKALCQIMLVRALVEVENWKELFGWIPSIYRTDSKYDISLNLILMQAGKSRFEDDDYLNALLLYRMVLPREKLMDFSNDRIKALTKKLDKDQKVGIKKSVLEERQNDINNITDSVQTLSQLPPYEEEVTFRIGQIYTKVKRYWESYVLFEQLYNADRNSEIGEISMLKSVRILYEIGEIARAEERILRYLKEKSDGLYARTLLSMMVRDNLVKQKYDQVIGLRPSMEGFSSSQAINELALQANLHYMTAISYFQTEDYTLAGEQFSVVLDRYPDSISAADSRYYRGMANMLQADYAKALTDFRAYQQSHEFGEHVPSSLFREAVCEFGLDNIPSSESAFTLFIEKFPDNDLVSEAYSMLGDIEAAKDGPHKHDRALTKYRKGIDKATTSHQAAYAAFQAAKVYKLVFKWQEIIDLMNYYMDRWKEKADVAEAIFWIGLSQVELGQVPDAVAAYLDAIERFGNDPLQQGVDKIILELVTVSSNHLSEEDRKGLSLKLQLKLARVDEHMDVLRLRLQVTQALLQGDDIAAALGATLLKAGTELERTTPVSLSLMCDAAVNTENLAEMDRFFEYFFANFEESDLLWHACRAKVHALLAADDHGGVLAAIDEAQGLFGTEPFMAWAQLFKAKTQYKMGQYEEAEKGFKMIRGIPEWRGPVFAEATYSMGKCRQATGDLETAHSYFQRTYLLYKGYADGDWAARGFLAAADVLVKLRREEDAINTLKAMLDDEYTNTNPLAEQVRKQLKKIEGNNE